MKVIPIITACLAIASFEDKVFQYDELCGNNAVPCAGKMTGKRRVEARLHGCTG